MRARECTLQLLACLYFQPTSSVLPQTTLQAREEEMKENYSKTLSVYVSETGGKEGEDSKRMRMMSGEQ